MKKHILSILLVLVVASLAGRTLFQPGYFNMHDDLQMMRQLQMEKCFTDGQIPCRWTPDMAYGYGYAMFNFYPPLPYLVGQGIRLLGFSFVNTAKALFLLAFAISGVAMYALAQEFFGPFGGVLAAVFYIWAPYHSVDIFVRGAMNEAWAINFFPLILWTSYKLIANKKKKQLGWIIALALSWFALLTSHNLMVLVFGPIFAVWVLVWLIKQKAWVKVPQLILSGIWALGLSAFFTIPAIVENKFTHIEDVLSGYYDYTAHFVGIPQLLFSRFWGYGPSLWGVEADRMSFQVGHIHWVLTAVLGFLIVFRIYKTKKIDKVALAALFAMVVGWVVMFLAHPKSIFIYQVITPLRFLQFPWRILAVVIFLFSFAAGSLAKALPRKFVRLAGLILMASLIIWNWNYFLPEKGKMGPLEDWEKFSGKAWEYQQTSGIYDYLPLTAKDAPKAQKKKVVEILEGEAEIIDPKEGTNWASFKVDVVGDKAVVRVNILEFPKWEVMIDGKDVEHYVAETEEWGRIYVDVPQGSHEVELRFVNTPIRTVSNFVSLGAWVFLGVSVLKLKGGRGKGSRAKSKPD